MDATILDPLPFRLELSPLRDALRVREGSAMDAELARLVAQAEEVARPRAIYRLVFLDQNGADFVEAAGQRFTSRILRVNLDGLHRFFAFVCTAGRELDAWAAAHDDLWAKFAADAINEAVLRAAVLGLRGHLRETYGLHDLSMMNPGSLVDWPMQEQRPLFALLGDVQAAIGVKLRDSLLMTPIKSVSGVLFPTEETFASCQLCPREVCPNRRAAYDPELYRRKYAAVG